MDKLLTISEVAERTGFKKKTLQNWISLKKFPIQLTIVKGNKRVRESALEKYLDKQTVKQ